MPYILPIHSIRDEDSILVGSKALSLAQLCQHDLPVPDGFVVTKEAMDAFFQSSNLDHQIKEELSLLNPLDPTSLQTVSHRIKHHILAKPVPKRIAKTIFDAYDDLGSRLKPASVALRTSIIQPHNHLSGELPLYLHIQGESTVVELIKDMWAFFFSPEFLATKEPLAVSTAIIVQKMVPAHTSGYLHTIDNRTEDKNTLLIESILGYGEYLIQGYVKPSRYVLNKQTGTLVNKTITSQHIFLSHSRGKTVQKTVPKELYRLALTSDQLQKLYQLSKSLQKIHFYPQTAEWSMTKNNQIFLLQTQPLLTPKTDVFDPPTETEMVDNDRDIAIDIQLPVLLEGIGVSPGITSGKVKVIHTLDDVAFLNSHDIAVISELNPAFFPTISKANGIIAVNGASGTEEALMAREYGTPTILGVAQALKALRPRQIITIDGTQGLIYQGSLEHTTKDFHYSRTTVPIPVSTDFQHDFKIATQVFVDLPSGHYPQTRLVESDIHGIMHIRGELVLGQLNLHPKQIVQKNQNQAIQYLKKHVMEIAQAHPQHDIFYKLSDWQSHMTRQLAHGKSFEPPETNPMLGYRASYRLLLDPTLLNIDIEALIAVQRSCSNVHLVLPWVRTPEELVHLKEILAARNLISSVQEPIWLSLASPANLIEIPQYLNLQIKGFCVDLDLISQLMQGIDASNPELMALYQETPAALIWLLQHAAQYATAAEVPMVVVGKASGQSPHFVEKMVHAGISGLAVPHDLVQATRQYIAKAEKKLIEK